MRIYNKSLFKPERKVLRNNPTKAETILWNAIRKKKLGYKFRRQYGIYNYIVDFYCPLQKLVIEIDGAYHLDKHKKIEDVYRDLQLLEINIRVLRFSNQEVVEDLSGVLEKIKKQLES